MELIDKADVVAEIEKRLDELYNLLPDASKVENNIIDIPEACNTGKYMALESFREFLDTLEVKEVDLEKDAFIEEACKFLKINAKKHIYFDEGNTEWYDSEELIEDFKTYMKGE